jgi:5-methyltetrahydrofolate--homocysteine methyltransferase
LIIIGERINSTRAGIREAIKAKKPDFLIDEAKKQLACGAQFIDINCAMSATDEVQDIDWTVSVIQSALPGVSICLDSPNPLAIKRALEVYKAGGELFINSITAEEKRMADIAPLALKYDAKLIALTMGAEGMPNSAEDRFAVARSIMLKLSETGFDAKRLYFDPLIRPVSTEPEQAKEVLRSIPMIKSLGANTVCGLSNVSFGLPDRKVINSAFLAMALYAGLDAAILDPTEKQVMSVARASAAILSDDEYCAAYIGAFREGRLV